MSYRPNSLEARDVEALLHPTTNLKIHRETGPVVISEAQGIYVRDNHGKEYIEGMAGLWCTALGYGVEELAETAREQMMTVSFSHLFAGKSHTPAIELAEKLKELSPLDSGKVFFGNSGSDANDTQIKLVRYYNNAVGRPEKKKIISRDRAYHGVTVASGSLTGLPAFHANFDLPIDGVLRTDAPHYYHGAEEGETEEGFSERLAANLTRLIEEEGPETIAAFIAEPVMGAGGVVVPPKGYFEAIKPVLDAHEIIFIDDEVICGFGRTGNWFGAETYNMAADTMSVAKALTSAYIPLSAVLIPDWLFEPMVEASGEVGTFGHGFTYTGHPVACAVGLKTIELMEQWNIVDHVRRVAPVFADRLDALANHELIGEARYSGLVGCIEIVEDKAARRSFDPKAGVGLQVQMRAEKHGLIMRAMGDNLAFCPPLIIEADEINEMFDRLEKALNETALWVKNELS